MTDLATSQKPDYSRSVTYFVRLILTVCVYLPAFVLTSFVYVKGYAALSENADFSKPLTESGILSQWTSYRNDLYVFYAIAIAASSMAILLTRANTNSPWTVLLRELPSRFVIGMLALTFSYALGAYMLEVTFTNPGIAAGLFNHLQKLFGQ